MKKKRHSSAEIAAKLRQADAMRREGMPAGKVAQALGISVMTYHRWRKAREPLGTAATARERALPRERHESGRIEQLELENSRLRRLVADILLEKLQLEESLRKRV
jgi:putative transposase